MQLPQQKVHPSHQAPPAAAAQGKDKHSQEVGHQGPGCSLYSCISPVEDKLARHLDTLCSATAAAASRRTASTGLLEADTAPQCLASATLNQHSTISLILVDLHSTNLAQHSSAPQLLTRKNSSFSPP